jgi:hypothetical protein
MKRFLPFFLVAAVTVWAGSAFGAGWVTVGLPLDNDNLVDAESVGGDIPYCTVVSEWTGGWSSHTVGSPVNNFACAVTKALFAYVTQDSVWTLTGGVIDSTAYSFSLVAGWNFVTVPLNKLGLTNAELLGQDIPNCQSVAEWVAASQGWSTHTVGSPVNQFATRVGYPYMVYCTAAGTWGGGTAAAAKPAGQSQQQVSQPRSIRLAPISER